MPLGRVTALRAGVGRCYTGLGWPISRLNPAEIISKMRSYVQKEKCLCSGEILLSWSLVRSDATSRESSTVSKDDW